MAIYIKYRVVADEVVEDDVVEDDVVEAEVVEDEDLLVLHLKETQEKEPIHQEKIDDHDPDPNVVVVKD
jgi:hypothetical protein